ncbi:MAG: hypothetical protein WBZ11_07805 [Candidatus Sulfotelmatobacter sp.]
MVPGDTAIETKDGEVPTPVNVTTCGLEAPVSVTVRLPDRLPNAVGENVTDIVQLAAYERVAGLAGQLLVAVKSDKLVVILPIAIAVL